MGSFGGTVPATSEMNILVDWTNSSNLSLNPNNGTNLSNETQKFSPTNYPQNYSPRRLRSSRSASNALSQCSMMTRHNDDFRIFPPNKTISAVATVCSSRILNLKKENSRSNKNLVTDENMPTKTAINNLKGTTIYKRLVFFL